MTIIPIDALIKACENEKRGRLREPFPGEEPDFIQDHDKLCTGMIFSSFSVGFNPPIQLVAGCGYAFEEDVDA